jgi:hypothetical protein
MDDEHDEDRELRELLDSLEVPPVPEEAEEPEVYTPEEYQLAQQIKAKRLFKEENNRPPYTVTELSHFLIKATNIERPLTPDDDDLKAARRTLEAAGS